MSGGPHLVFLYGPPAVGKLTVAQALAQRQPFTVLHNHVTIDAVAQVLPFGTTAFWDVVGRFRRDLAVVAAAEGVDLVYTYVFAPGDEGHVDAIAGPYLEAGGTVTFVRLVASPDELLRRVGNPSRKEHGKLVDSEVLSDLLEQHDLFSEIPGRTSLTIDLETTTADEAADAIIRDSNS